ncbi:hypothetical protein HAZT_HAZT005805 [Hyalella azteca]|uniref:Uncharacterized protein n=1 Tax=Hyalella azteca TaxID=294128 RepID=A0A6A0H0Y3_HYAAZ|nr:hypothetical protein HAZT_HAZT005805 [Hyalella azteca]
MERLEMRKKKLLSGSGKSLQKLDLDGSETERNVGASGGNGASGSGLVQGGGGQLGNNFISNSGNCNNNNNNASSSATSSGACSSSNAAGNSGGNCNKNVSGVAASSKALFLEKVHESTAACQAGDFDTAVALYTEAIALDPQNHILYSNRSAAHIKLQQFQKALQDATKARDLNPKWPKVSP